MKGRAVFIFMAVLAVALAGAVVVSAQFSVISYGQTVEGSFSDAAPLNLYAFQGAAGDLAVVQVIPLTAGIQPTIGVVDPSNQSVANSTGDVISPADGDAAVAFVLPSTGIYTILVGSETGPSGDYLVRLFGIPTVDGGSLANGSSPRVIAQPGGVVYSFEGNPGDPTRIRIDADGSDSLVRALLITSSGQVVSSASGNTSLMVSLPPLAGTFRLIVILVDGNPISFTATTGGANAAPGVVTTQEAQPPRAGDGQCSITPANPGGANVRSGPGEVFAVIGSLGAGQTASPIGINNGWYALSNGWVFSGVVIASGNCNALPQVAAPAAPPPTQPPAQATQPAGPTATPSPTADLVAVTQTQPVQQQVAPPDSTSNGVLTVPLDGSASVTDYVSYPGGDTEDRVSYDVTGLNNNVAFSGGQATLTITALCTGTGTQYIQFVADGGQAFGCGQTVLTRIVNFDSRTGGVRITATGGTNTYVQWTLIGNAPRVN